MSESTWATVKDIAKKELCNKRLFVVDAFCGANKDTRMAIRFIVEVAWQAHFVTNMFIKPTAEELENFEPDFVVYNASKAKVENYKELGLYLHPEWGSIPGNTSGYQLSDAGWIYPGLWCYVRGNLTVYGKAAEVCGKTI